MKKLFIKIGNLTALLFLFLPLVILSCTDKLKDTDVVVFLFFSIAYDFYYYNKIMQFDSYMEEQKNFAGKILNKKIIDSETFEGQMRWFAIIGITTLDKYFEEQKENTKKMINDIHHTKMLQREPKDKVPMSKTTKLMILLYIAVICFASFGAYELLEFNKLKSEYKNFKSESLKDCYNNADNKRNNLLFRLKFSNSDNTDMKNFIETTYQDDMEKCRNWFLH